MQIELLTKEKQELEIQVKGADETLLVPLLNRLLTDKQVDYASYFMGHILLDDPKLYVRTTKGAPKTVLKRAVKSLVGNLETIRKELPT